jgi:hypothetical protein
MILTRRVLLQTPVILAASEARPAQMLPAPSEEPPALGACAGTLAALADTLLPAEGDSPAASALGIPARMLEVAQRRVGYARLMHAGCRWLDDAARERGAERFTALDEAGRQTVVAAAESADPGSIARTFFSYVHRHAMDLFYSHPDAWRALDYPGPPQPNGFLDYADPPGKGSG